MLKPETGWQYSACFRTVGVFQYRFYYQSVRCREKKSIMSCWGKKETNFLLKCLRIRFDGSKKSRHRRRFATRCQYDRSSVSAVGLLDWSNGTLTSIRHLSGQHSWDVYHPSSFSWFCIPWISFSNGGMATRWNVNIEIELISQWRPLTHWFPQISAAIITARIASVFPCRSLRTRTGTIASGCKRSEWMAVVVASLAIPKLLICLF